MIAQNRFFEASSSGTLHLTENDVVDRSELKSRVCGSVYSEVGYFVIGPDGLPLFEIGVDEERAEKRREIARMINARIRSGEPLTDARGKLVQIKPPLDDHQIEALAHTLARESGYDMNLRPNDPFVQEILNDLKSIT